MIDSHLSKGEESRIPTHVSRQSAYTLILTLTQP